MDNLMVVGFNRMNYGVLMIREIGLDKDEKHDNNFNINNDNDDGR